MVRVAVRTGVHPGSGRTRLTVRAVPVVRFAERSGQVRTGRPRHDADLVPPRPGERVHVSYDADDPGWWVLGTRGPGTAMFLVVGTGFAVVGVGALVVAVLIAVLAPILA